MSLAIRRLIYSVFIIIFIVITPLIIIYAAGYKFSPYGFKLEKTGIFILDSKPRGAKIYLDGKIQKSIWGKIFNRKNSFITTPAKIKNLRPGDYDIKIELDGYQPWQKKLTIESGASTYAEDINLFKIDLPIIILPETIIKIIQSPDKLSLAVLTSKKLFIYNQETEVIKSIDVAGPNDNFSWSPSSKKILLGQQVINIENLMINNLADFDLGKIYSAIWDLKNDNVIYYTDKNNIYSYEILTKNHKKIIADQKFNNFLIKDDYAYLINNTTGAASLNIMQISSGQLIRSINLPGSDKYDFINTNFNLLNLYDSQHQILYLIDPLATIYYPLIETINNIKYSLWASSNRLLYANDFEIWYLDLAAKDKTLITRISQKINDIIWHPSNNYVLYFTDQEIYTVELDQREKRNINELLKLEEISQPFINRKGNLLFFQAKIGNQVGLYKLAI